VNRKTMQTTRGPRDAAHPVALDYLETKYQNTLKEWQKFVGGDKRINSDVIPHEILEGWERSAAMGIDPLKRPRNQILSGKDLESLLKENEDIITVSRVFMNHLYRFMTGSRFTVTLFDRRGYLLEIMMQDEFKANAIKAYWVVGAKWDESVSGNNGIGTVLVLKKPIRIFGPQHFNAEYHYDTISSAPIFGPDGEFLGGLSIMSYYYKTSPNTLAMTVTAAQTIENQLQIQKALNEAQIASSYQKTVIASIPEALITINNKGCISLLNDNAVRLFHLERKQVEGKTIASVFGEENQRFLSLLDGNNRVSDQEVRIFAGDAGNDYTLTCNTINSPQGETLGKIIILNEIKRVKTLVARMIGAKANFQFRDIHGQNPRFLKTVEQARTVSQSTSNVLLLGKSGTGKDIFAQAIHNASARKNGPYVAINCAAIPRDLITSELFGYSEGAYTGSRRGGNPGKFELADGGTIFLDEIAETPLELQAVLLRVIEDKSIIRIGGTRIRPVNVRIVAATNKDLLEEVRRGNFREDLFYRLNVFTLQLIPLRERLDDIPILLDYLINKYSKLMGKRIDSIDARVTEVFLRYPWPGNVRELQNVIERMMNVAHQAELTVDLIPSEILNYHGIDDRIEKPVSGEKKNGPETPDHMISVFQNYNSLREKAEEEMISQMLSMGIPKNKIAQKMNLSRMTVYRKMKRYKLS
jgi:sigma-54 dependent transcriptional regulator, acetoin dehydrogenase operon transcriptional activator AcoR